MIGDKKLKKDSKDLYLEPYKDGKDFKWKRKLESLWMDLYDVKIIHYAMTDLPPKIEYQSPLSTSSADAR